MKPKLIKTAVLFALLAGLAACEEQVDYKDEGLDFDMEKDLQSALQQKRMPLLAVRLGCNACHAIDHKVIGPAWQEVGKRYQGAATFQYQGKAYPVTEGLVQKISQGGSGNWGVEPMPAMDPSGSKHAYLEKLAGFILELGKR